MTPLAYPDEINASWLHLKSEDPRPDTVLSGKGGGPWTT